VPPDDPSPVRPDSVPIRASRDRNAKDCPLRAATRTGQVGPSDPTHGSSYTGAGVASTHKSGH